MQSEMQAEHMRLRILENMLKEQQQSGLPTYEEMVEVPKYGAETAGITQRREVRDAR